MRLWGQGGLGLAYLFLSVALGAAGHLFAKAGVMRAGSAFGALAQPLVWLAVALYGASFAVWLGFLRDRPVSAAVPCSALTYVLVMVAGVAFLGERLTAVRAAGAVLVLGGVYLLVR